MYCVTVEDQKVGEAMLILPLQFGVICINI